MVEEQELHLSVSGKGYAQDILKEVVYGYCGSQRGKRAVMTGTYLHIDIEKSLLWK